MWSVVRLWAGIEGSGEKNIIFGHDMSSCYTETRRPSYRTRADRPRPCSPTFDDRGLDNIITTVIIKVYLGYVAKRKAESAYFIRVSSGATLYQLSLSNKGSGRKPSQGSQLRQHDVFPNLSGRDSHARRTL
jgi:hypothetical protein